MDATKKICRICLMEKNDDYMTSIYKKASETYQQKDYSTLNLKQRQIDLTALGSLSIFNLIVACSPEKVIDFNGFPKRVCEKCLRDLFAAYFFRMRCKNAFRVLINMLFGSCDNEVSQTNCENDNNTIQCNAIASDVEQSDNGHNYIEREKNEKAAIPEEPKDRNCQNPDICDKTKENGYYAIETSEILHIDINNEYKLDVLETKEVNEIDLNGSFEKSPNKTLQILPQHNCPECGLSFSNEKDLSVHRHAHLQLRYKCVHCNRSFSQVETLQCHKKFCALSPHENANHGVFQEEPNQNCDQNETPKNRVSLGTKNNPAKTRTRKQYNYNCSICPRTFNYRKSLRAHLASHKKYKRDFNCEMCPKSFVVQRSLKKHLLVAHNKPTFTCRRCGDQFDTNDELDEHLKSHAKQTSFLCSACGKHFKSNNALKGHIMSIHTNEQPFKCKQCGKGFSWKNSLELHLRRHSDVKPYVCSICGKGFIDGSKMRFHMRVHTGERPYQCTFCDRSFAQSNDLKVHIRRHTGERFKCEICSESFIQNYLLSRHKRNEHGINIESRHGRLKPKSDIKRISESEDVNGLDVMT